MRWLVKGKFKLFQEQRGFTILEALIALGILGFIGVAFISALSTTSMSADAYEERVTASALAESQIEEIQAMDYDADGDYPVAVTLPPEYSMSISTVEPEAGKQEVTVKVYRGGDFVLELSTVKTDW